MRVISGLYKGRNLKGFDIEGTRPTMDRVKESIFSSIQSYVDEAVCLDLFSGSGNLGIEALSNGASSCYFVDINKKAVNTIKENIDMLNITNYIVMNSDYKDALNHFKDNNIKFDLIFLDPPYKLNVIDSIVNFIIDNDLINDKGLIICEFDSEIKKEYEKLTIFKEKKYGSKYVVIFKK